MVSDLGMIVALLVLLLSISAGTYVWLSKCFPDLGVIGGVQTEDSIEKTLNNVPDNNDLTLDDPDMGHNKSMVSLSPDKPLPAAGLSDLSQHNYSAEPPIEPPVITNGLEGAKEDCEITTNPTNRDKEDDGEDQHHQHHNNNHSNGLQTNPPNDKCILSNGGFHHSNGKRSGLVNDLDSKKEAILIHIDEGSLRSPTLISSKSSNQSPNRTTQLAIVAQRSNKRRAQKISHIHIANGLLETTLWR